MATIFDERDAQITKRVAEGHTYASVGREYGLGRERCRQIATKMIQRIVRRTRPNHPKALYGVTTRYLRENNKFFREALTKFFLTGS